MKPLTLFTLLVIILFPPFPRSASAQSYEIRGNLREWVKVFTEGAKEIDLAETRLKLEILSPPGGNTAFRIVNYCTVDAANDNEPVWDLKEAYLDYYSPLVDVRLGKQIISWGKADELNPTDNLNPQDLSNITEDKIIRKIGLLALKTDWKFSDYVLEGIWKLDFEPTQIPDPDSPWAFFSIPGVTTLPSPTYPEDELANTEWALKLSRTISLFDFSLSYFNGWENIFTPQFTLDPATNQTLLEDLTFNRAKVFGADFAGSIGSVGVWGEGAYFQTEDEEGEDPSLKNPYFQYVLGADYTFAHKIKVNLQYLKEIITRIDNEEEREQEEEIISRLGIGMPLQEALTFRLEKKFGQIESHKIELFTIWDLKENGLLLKPALTLSPADAFFIEVGTVIFTGEEGSIFQNFDHNDELYLKCTYAF